MALTRVRAEQIIGISKTYAPIINKITPVYLPPNVTQEVVLEGEFYTPDITCFFSGQTINLIKFESTKQIKVSITTGSNQFESVNVTLNNGKEATFLNRWNVSSGELTIPSAGNWVDVTAVDTSEDGVLLGNLSGTTGRASYNYDIPVGEDFLIEWRVRNIAQYPSPVASLYFQLIDNVLPDYNLELRGSSYIEPRDRNGYLGAIFSGEIYTKKFGVRRIGNVTTILKDDVVQKTLNYQIVNSMRAKFFVTQRDIYNIKIFKL